MKKSDWVVVVLLFGVTVLGIVELIKAANTPDPDANATILNIKDMTQVQCDDIVGKPDAYTGKRDLVCEIHMQQEDDNIIILKENK